MFSLKKGNLNFLSKTACQNVIAMAMSNLNNEDLLYQIVPR